MHTIAKVVVDVAHGREFDYSIPPELAGNIGAGSRVLVPFGKTERQGYVVAVADRSDLQSLRPILSLVGEKPLVHERVLDLARWMAGYYCVSVEQAIRAVLPAAVRRTAKGYKEELVVSVVKGSGILGNSAAGECAPVAEPVRVPSREEGGGAGNGSGILTNSATGVGHGRKGALRSAGLTPAQAAVLELLRADGPLPLHELLRRAGVSPAPVKALEKKGLVKLGAGRVQRDPLAGHTILPTQPLDLMPAQAAALEMIRRCIDAATPDPRPPTPVSPPPSGQSAIRNPQSAIAPPRVVLLYGVTGSGKTEVYLQAIDYVLSLGKGAIVLVPEIALTPQTVERFVSRFGSRIAVLHSHLSDGERHDEWHRIRDGAARIVVGARSAVFAPVHELGLIVVDEEHEPTYKQEEAPRYSARDVAVMRGRMEGCAVVLGSATPSIESWQNARTGKYLLANLPHRADNRKMPVMHVIDMRAEGRREGKGSVFSQPLMEAISRRLERGEQTMLFLNRRGYATSLICPACGYVANCDRCSVSYTYHSATDCLRCHICGGAKPTPKRCPQCGDPKFRFAGVGTQRVESIVAKCFPRARVQRMDTDVTTGKHAYERILGDFRTGKIDILVGTQMIAKGLHFPNVTLVGVVYADLSLHMPDFRAGERTFQLLAQVAGRAGRGEVPGEVIVQTYTPFHPAIQAARRLDFEGHCDQELEFRKELSYPPFTHLACLTLRGRSEDKVAYSASALFKELKPALSDKVILAEPTPAPLARAKGLYRYQIIMRCATPSRITEPVVETLKKFRFPQGIACAVDVDAVSLL